MAVGNTLTKAVTVGEKAVEYMAGEEKISLTPNMIKSYLVSGDANKVTSQEVIMFLNLCRYQHLNPFLREAYLIKYSSNDPATLVVGKDAFTKRAQRNKSYKGNQAGVIVKNDSGELSERIGSMVLDGEEIVGGWAKVYVDGYEIPVEVTVSFGEYVGKKADGTINRQWKSKPATMIRKVALTQALREAFPEDFSGMYSAEEMGVDPTMLSDVPVNPVSSEEAPEVVESEISDCDDPFAN